jgi:thiamine biosynthesis lipoprotein
MTVLFRPAIFILSALFILSACKPGDRPQEKRTRFLMGTLVEISIPGPATARTEEASNLAFAEMARLEQMMSTHRPDSELSRVNDNAGGSFTPVSPELIEVVRRGLEWGERSQGALAMSLGPVVDLWHFDGESGPPPAGESLAQALTRVDEGGIDIRGREIRLKRPGMKLDLGAIAKGFAVDRAIGVLASRGVENALVNAGGDLSVLGRPSTEKAWRVGLRSTPKGSRWPPPAITKDTSCTKVCATITFSFPQRACRPESSFPPPSSQKMPPMPMRWRRRYLSSGVKKAWS